MHTENINKKALRRINRQPVGMLLGKKYLIVHPDYYADYIMVLTLSTQSIATGTQRCLTVAMAEAESLEGNVFYHAKSSEDEVVSTDINTACRSLRENIRLRNAACYHPYRLQFELTGMADMPQSMLRALCDEMALFDNADKDVIEFETTSERLGKRMDAYLSQGGFNAFMRA